MRFLAFLLGGIGLFFLSGYLYLRRMGLDPKGTTIPQSICSESPTRSAKS